jgi:hypothetical protein
MCRHEAEEWQTSTQTRPDAPARRQHARDAQPEELGRQLQRCSRRRAVGQLLLATVLACGCSAQPVHIDLADRRPLAAVRRQAAAPQSPPIRCLTAVVERPTIGQCIEVFSRPVPLRTCVRNETEAQARVNLPIVGPRARCPPAARPKPCARAPGLGDFRLCARAPRVVWRGLWLTAQRNMSRSLAIADLSSYANLAQAYVNQQCRLRWQDWVVPPSFVYTCYGGTKEMQICKGLDDFFTCTLGTCIRLSDRPDWPIDWWERVDPAQFGGA